MTTLRELIIEKLPKKKDFCRCLCEKTKLALEYNKAIDDTHSSIDDIIGVVREEIMKLGVNTPLQVAELNKNLDSTLQKQSYQQAIGYWNALEDIKELLK